jgi:hypothetical protein
VSFYVIVLSFTREFIMQEIIRPLVPRVLKYHTGVWRMTYNPAGPRTPKYIAVYICSMGLWDIAFVSFYVIVLSFTREFIMQEIIRPLAVSRTNSKT